MVSELLAIHKNKDQPKSVLFCLDVSWRGYMDVYIPYGALMDGILIFYGLDIRRC